MAGHSKWANIKHRKAAQDAKRGKLFTKLIRELVVAARAGGAVVEDNPRLRAAVDKALGANMKRDTIDNAIARGAGTGEADNMEELTYEGYAPGGVAVLVEVMTDNRNRTVAEVRHAFTKRGGNLGTDGSVAYLFSRIGLIQFAPGVDEEAVLEAALEAGADDIVAAEDGSVDVMTPWECVTEVRDALVCMSRGFAVNNTAKQVADKIDMPIMLAKNISGPMTNKTPPKLGPIAVPTARGVVIQPFARP